MKNIFIFLIITMIIASCNLTKDSQTNDRIGVMDKNVVDSVISELVKKSEGINQDLIKKGVTQVATLWNNNDGNASEFKDFCINNFAARETEKDSVFTRLSAYIESLVGNFNKMSLNFQKNVHLDLGPISPVDEMFAAYEPGAHYIEDFFNNKIAFYIILNFPHYSLEEKLAKAKDWTSKEWAYARLGDYFISRVPAEVRQKIAKALADADLYISQYNIYPAKIIDSTGKSYFPADMKLLSHWNIRDEIKANYGKENGLYKQQLLFKVMNHIVLQDIPKEVINSDKYNWDVNTNKIFNGTTEIASNPETNVRYQKIVESYKAVKEEDKYNVDLNTYIKRKFEGEMEMTQPDVEKLFVDFISSKEVKEVANLISKRMGRKLEPFDLWYDGFKVRSTLKVEELDNWAKKHYPSSKAFKDDMPQILTRLGFKQDISNFIASKVEVDAARGSGHAWGAQMHDMNSHLRTRIEKDGMNYKGFNIAMHEFGHNVEQTISLHKVDQYMMAGVPNTAFTEALAFIFQRRDMEMMGRRDNDHNKEHLMALDNFWALYEIMGVSLVDMNVWKWLYEHPEATADELKVATLTIAKEVWNKYYAEVFGIKDQVILGIYSHMISYPLYLSAYPVGHLIDFQIEQYIKGKDFGKEVERIYSQGRLVPDEWMMRAVGEKISINPMIKAVDEALKHVN